jgi:hypothetical protein
VQKIIDRLIFLRMAEDRGIEEYGRLQRHPHGGPADGRCQPQSRAHPPREARRGVPVGRLGYLDGKPVAWCSIAPRSTYRELGGPPQAAGENVWSLVCFLVTRAYRGPADRRGGGARAAAGRDRGRGLPGGPGLAQLSVHGLRGGLSARRVCRGGAGRDPAARDAFEAQTRWTLTDFPGRRVSSLRPVLLARRYNFFQRQKPGCSKRPGF